MINPGEAEAPEIKSESTPSGNTPLRPSPEFTHYKDNNGDVVSYDPHFNSDGSFFQLAC